MMEFIRGMNKSSINGKNPPPILKFEKEIEQLGFKEIIDLTGCFNFNYLALFLLI